SGRPGVERCVSPADWIRGTLPYAQKYSTGSRFPCWKDSAGEVPKLPFLSGSKFQVFSCGPLPSFGLRLSIPQTETAPLGAPNNRRPQPWAVRLATASQAGHMSASLSRPSAKVRKFPRPYALTQAPLLARLDKVPTDVRSKNEQWPKMPAHQSHKQLPGETVIP